ncbi:MAG TPA: iron uptake transporter permease EfeU [Kineosporiaceae bacterium]
MGDSVLPSLLIGLREGLEGGLIVSILIAALVKANQRDRARVVWAGVLAAVALSLSVGAVLTFTAAGLPPRAQEVFGGTLSIIAVGFVTAMVFWMRRSARNLSGELRTKVTEALALDGGGGMLLSVAFLAVAREGLETALFLWTTAQAAHSSVGPLLGAAIGLAIAAGLCWGLYRRVLRLNLSRVFGVTGGALIVIAAGVLGYGFRDLQEGGALPGAARYAFDVSSAVNPGSWYAALLQGTFNLTPAMTWLQVAAYAAYLGVVMTLFVRGLRATARQPVTAGTPTPPAATPPAATSGKAGVGPAGPTARKRPWLLPAAVVAVPAVGAGGAIWMMGPARSASAEVNVSVTGCGGGLADLRAGQQSIALRNTGSDILEVYLVDAASGAVHGEVEGLAPGTTRPIVATLGSGTYALTCVHGASRGSSPVVTVHGGTGHAVAAVAPVVAQDLSGPVAEYRRTITAGLAELTAKTDGLAALVASGDLAGARTAWLPAHLAYARLGAAYGTFGAFDGKIDRRPDGLPGGVSDPDFTGFLRLEHGLWHGESAASLKTVADRLAADVHGLQQAFPTQETDPGDLPLRAHEILENTLQFELTGATDQGSGTNLATAQANLEGTRAVLAVLRPLLVTRDPQALARIDGWLDRLDRQLAAARHPDGAWTPPAQLAAASRQALNATLGQLLEYLAPVPDVLEIRASR